MANIVGKAVASMYAILEDLGWCFGVKSRAMDKREEYFDKVAKRKVIGRLYRMEHQMLWAL